MHTNQKLIENLRQKKIADEQVLAAMLATPREMFVAQDEKALAYVDRALPIGSGQTISQPYIIALMTQALLHGQRLKKVLEVGTGSGYQAAILSHLVDEVYTIERIESLSQQAKQKFQHLKIKNIFTMYGDGYAGWQEHAPFDGIIVTAAASTIPTPLLEQLAENGRLVIPVADGVGQVLKVITRQKDQFDIQVIEHVIFVPLLRGVRAL
jgi:protein-L-isoaspartate(D-aspartate) O-methyltransferase